MEIVKKKVLPGSEELREVHALLCEAFPQDECLAFETFSALVSLPDNELFACYQGDLLVATSMRYRKDGFQTPLYLAARKVAPSSGRGIGFGVGAMLLDELKHEAKVTFGAVEDPDDESAPNPRQRKLRVELYKRLGAVCNGATYVINGTRFIGMSSAATLSEAEFAEARKHCARMNRMRAQFGGAKICAHCCGKGVVKRGFWPLSRFVDCPKCGGSGVEGWRAIQKEVYVK